MEELIYLPVYNRYAILVQRNAYYSVISWIEGGCAVQTEVENDEYEFVETYEDDD